MSSKNVGNKWSDERFNGGLGSLSIPLSFFDLFPVSLTTGFDENGNNVDVNTVSVEGRDGPFLTLVIVDNGHSVRVNKVYRAHTRVKASDQHHNAVTKFIIEFN